LKYFVRTLASSFTYYGQRAWTDGISDSHGARSAPCIGAILAAISLLSPATLASAKNWNDGTGNWNVAANWSPASVPATGEAVNIVFTDGVARTVTLNATASLGLLSVDLTGSGTAASTLSVPNNNTLSANGILIGGYNGSTTTSGRGAMTQSDGMVSTNAGWDFVLGHGANSTGTYTLSGSGKLTANQSEYIGLSGNGTFNQSGGTNTIATATGFFNLGTNAGSTGTYNLSGTGALVSNIDEYIGNIGTGVFNQIGGTNTISGAGHSLWLGYNGSGTGGAYTLSAGSLDVSGGGENIGTQGPSGSFNQSGGTNTVNTLNLGGTSAAMYTMSGGNLTCLSQLIIWGPSIFNQTAGTNVASSLFVGDLSSASGTYNLGGTGSLSTPDETIGNGAMNQTGGTNVVAGVLRLGAYAGHASTYALSAGRASISSDMFLGGTTSGAGGTGVLTVSGTGVLTVGGVLKAYNTAGTALNLSGGTINAGALNFGGVPGLFNWTSGTLNLTSNVTWDSAAATSTSTAFGSSLALGSNQTLMITGNEILGGAGSFALTLNSGSTHYVTGTLTVGPTGTVNQNAGSTLYAATINQAGGTVNGTLQNQGNFIYQSGQFNGRLLNQGTTSISNVSGASFTTGNGVENDGTMTVAAGQTLTVNGAGLDNLGTFTLGGVISGSGAVVNNFGGTMQAHGMINPTFTNNGVLDVDGVLRLNGATSTNNGIVGGSGTVIGNFANAAGGALDLSASDLLALSNAWTNSGLVTLQGNSVLGGGTITNFGTIQGTGTVFAPVTNSTGVVRAYGGELDLGAAGNTNAAAGLMQAATGNTIMVLQGLATNSGTIALTGGAFDNNNHALSNAGIINGYGTLRTGGLTSTGKLNVGEGNLDVFGSVTNNGTIGIQGGRSIYFFGNVSGSGSYTGIGTAVFLAAVSPGSSPASVSFGGNVDLASTATLNMELGGTTPGSQFDQLRVTGQLALGGALQVSLINSFAPLAGQTFDILDWGGLDGTFASINLPTLTGLTWNISQLYTTGAISVGLAGDYNSNGVVDAADYVVWRNGLGTIYTQNDYNIWRAHFGQPSSSGVGVSTNAAVPEPATWVLCAAALVLIVVRNRLPMRAVACSIVGVLFASALASSTWAADDTWKTAASGNWETGSSWTDGSTPANADTATIGQNGAYTVTFGATPAAIQQLSVNNGTNVTFQSSGGAIQTLSVNASGGSKTVNLSGSGTTLTLGTSNHTLNLTAGSSLSVQSGSKLQVQFGSDVAASDLSSSGLGGTVIVDGSGSTLTLNNSSAINSVGAGGGAGTLTFQNSSTGNSISGALGIADDAIANSDGAVNITSGSAVSLSGNLTLATQNITGQNSLLTINGTNSSLTQSGASSITIGSVTNGTAVLQVGIPTSGGTLTTGTGTLTINKTGSLYVGDIIGTFTGTLNANGNITVNGGQFVAGTGFNWATGKTMTIENGSNVTFSGAYTTVANATYNIHDANSSLQTINSFFALNNGASVNVSAGGAIGATGFNIGVGTAGTLSVDGSNSSASGSGGTMTWGSGGGTANVTFSNGAAGNFHRTMGLTTTSLAGSATAGTTTHVTVESGATFTTNALSVAAAGGTTTSATLDVTGAGSAVTVDSMVVGNAATDTAVVNVLSGGTLTVSGPSGNGSTTLNHTGTITINGGTLNTGGLTNNGGTLTFSSGTLGITGTNGLTIGSTGPLGNDVTVGSGQTVNVTNATIINGGASLTLNAGNLNSGSVTLNSTSTLGIRLGGTARGSQYGALTATGNVALAGSLVITLNSFTPSAGQTFDVLDWAPGLVSGTFSNLQLPALSPGLTWNTSQLYTAGIISVGQPGDYNNDNKVDAADYVTWRKGGGSQTDYNTWRANFGTNARAQGVDVSHFQGSTGISQDAWNQMSAEGKAFAFIKATEGLTGPDDAAMANNIARATSAGILDGVYHYAHPENRPTPAGAVSEADHFLNYAGANIGPGHLRPVLDIEGSSSQLTASALTDWVIAFSNEVVAMRGSSAEPIIYTTSFFTNNRFDSRIANYDLWIADQSNLNDPQTGNPSTSDLGQFSNWSFWQYAVGTAGGISPIDLDVVHGEYKPLSSFVIPSAMSASRAVPEPTSATFVLIALTALVLLPRVLVTRAHRSDLRTQ
jgi:fibronectin-binding autotransporter adhesin